MSDAYVLVWAADNAWFGAGADTEEGHRLEAVRVAAHSVVKENPGFVLGEPEYDEQLVPAGKGEAADRQRSGPGEERPGGAAPDTHSLSDQAPVEPGAGTVRPGAPTTSEESRNGDDDLQEICHRLAAAVDQAGPAARRALADLDDGRPPATEDLALLTGVRASFDRVSTAFTSAGVEVATLRLADLARAARAHQEAVDHDRTGRETLSELLALGCRTDEQGALSAAKAVREVAERLLGVLTWGEAERRESTALRALAELVRLGRRPEAAARILALQGQVVQGLPGCATAAVMAPELTLPEAPEVLQEAPSGAAAAEPLPSGSAPDRSEPGPPAAGAPGESADASQEGRGAVRHGARTEVPAPTTAPVAANRPGTEFRTEEVQSASETLGVSGAGEDTAPDGLRAETGEVATLLSSAVPGDEAGDTPPRTPVPRFGGESLEPGAVGSPDAESATRDIPAPSAPLAPRRGEARTEDVEQEDEATGAERALVQLVTERRFGLAHHVAHAAGYPESQVTALRLAGAAAQLTSGASQGARLVTDLLQRQAAFTGPDAEGSELLLCPALLRTALVTGDHMAGAQLKVMVPRLPEALADVATAVADRALSGALMIASPLRVIADVSEIEARLRELGEQGRTLVASQRLRFARATEIAKRWLASEDGMLGQMLTAVINDDRSAVEDVREKAERLSKLPEINAEIDRMDRKHRSSSGKPLQGSGRQDLVHVVERSVALAKDWCLTVDGARTRDHSDGGRAAKEISSLRQSMLARQQAVVRELDRLGRRPDTVAAAAAWAARCTMEELFALLSGDPGDVHPGGGDPGLALDVELLKVCDTVGPTPPLGLLLRAVDRGWGEALRERMDGDAFHAARTIVELGARGALPGLEGGALKLPLGVDRFEELQATRRTALGQDHDELAAELHRAQADGAVTDDQDLRLQELLADARARLDGTDEVDLVDVRRALRAVRTDLPRYRKEATDRIRARLDALELSEEDRAQVLRHLDTGGLATAADLVYFLEIGEPVPEIEAGESHLTEFFPSVPEGLAQGIDAELVELVRAGRKHPTVSALDYGNLSSDEAGLAADALNEWRELGVTEPKERPNIPPKRKLLPALKLLGYDAKSARPLDELSPQRREYRFFEVTGVEVNGRAKAPAFGSQIKEQGGNLRVLVVWGRPPAEMVMSLASRDPSETSLLVVYLGTLSREARTELAAGSPRVQPLLVVDDAALAYLAARGNRQVSTATQTLLPFSGVNPYIREKRGRIGGEMFYGRDAERKSILDPQGTQVIFGGRGLGKSALLSDAGERFVDQRPGFHQSVYVNLDQENIGKGSSLGPDALWSVLDRELTSAQVLARPQGRKAHKDRFERVREGIRSWLDGDSRRRLLVLLDECDQFFEADAPRFDQTKRLKGLGSDTKDRAKVVFAGLHSVQRFSKLASNGPFGHLAQTPKVIGPLAPQFAADLLVEPMRALGFEFDDVDLVNRVLGYCSYQPFLLQMFGHRLVELMHRKRVRRGAEGPPYTVRVEEIEAVESDTALRTGISAAFKDTLSLDHRYDVIANVLAYQARHHGLEMRLSDAELREECETWWRVGFERLDTEGFRAYLSEMVGLGVLAPNHDGQGWHLRGPNALRMIGTSHEVEARLLRAEHDCKLEESIVLEGRPELTDRRSAPLTITQLDDLLGERANQTRVVLGSRATGVADVGDTLRTVAGRIQDWTLPPVGKPSVYKQELMGGRPRERRVVISDFARYPAKPETCLEAVHLADNLLPHTPGVTRAVVLVTDPQQLDLWRVLLVGEEQTSAVPVVLRRHDRRSLHGWAQGAEVFSTDERRDRLYALSGGWPLLVDRAFRLHGEMADAEEALKRLAEVTMDRSAARAFIEATGVYASAELAAGYRSIVAEIGSEVADAEAMVTAIAYRTGNEEEARWVFACLEALQVFDREDAHLRLEPLLRRCVELDV